MQVAAWLYFNLFEVFFSTSEVKDYFGQRNLVFK